MTLNELRAVKAVKAINLFREQKSTSTFTLEELSKALKTNGCPYPGQVITILRNKLIISTFQTRGHYQFTTGDPIHYKTIENSLDAVAQTVKKYIDNCKSKNKIQVSTCKSSDVSEEELNNYIAILKANGYKIKKQIITYEEV